MLPNQLTRNFCILTNNLKLPEENTQSYWMTKLSQKRESNFHKNLCSYIKPKWKLNNNESKKSHKFKLILKVVFNKVEIHFPKKLKTLPKAQKHRKYFFFKRDSSHFFPGKHLHVTAHSSISKRIFKSKVTVEPSLWADPLQRNIVLKC